MIQPSDNRLQIRDLRSIKETGTTVTSEDEILNSKSKVEILNIYEEHLQVTSPTYSEEIKAVMKKEDIEQSNLHAEIVKTMTKSGINVTKNDLNIIVNQLQEEHLFKLFEEGYEIETLTVDIIAKEIIQNETIQREMIQNEMRPKAEDEEEKANENKDIAKILVEAGLPVTNKNIQVLEQYQDKIKEIAHNSDIAISNMIRHKSEITINNLYTAKHRGAPKDTENPPTEEQIIAVLNMNGIKATQDNIKAASNLVKDHVEITKDNVKDFVDIKELISKIDSNELVKKAAKEMKKGINLGDINISPKASNQATNLDYNEVSQLVKDIIADLPRIDETVIEDTYRKDKPITIENLQKTLHENVEKVMKKTNNKIEVEDNLKSDVKVEPEKIRTTKRQLEEIRLSLTLEAALKLNNKLDIKTTALTKVVEELKAIEKENNQDILRNTGTPVTEENVAQMKQTRDRIYNISQNKELAMAQVVEDKVDFTLEGMDQAIRLKHAQNTYEETGTRPERRFGEGIARVEEQLEHVLEMNQIEPTDSNVKAAKALVQNNIDISPEAIESAKIVLLKIETVVYELRPAVVAQLLKEGIRPDTMPIDNLIEHIREIQKDNQIDPTQKVAEAILELDKTNELNPTEREGLVAVYRMLSTITKNETAAIGFLLDNEKEATLGNLFEASKYIKQVGSKIGKMDVTVDDNLGMREGDLPANIRSLIGEATTVLTHNNIEINADTIEIANVARQKIETVLAELSPAVLAPLLKEGIRPSEMDIDRLIERVREIQKDTQIDIKQSVATETSDIDTTTELNPKERERLVETYRMLSTITKNEPAAIGFLLKNNTEPTLGEVFEASIELENPSEVASNKDIASEEKQIEQILTQNQIEPTDLNKKTAKVLMQNNIEVNTETIETAKEAFQKIETVLAELSPTVLTPLLKEGIRLSEMSIDHLIEHVQKSQTDTQIDVNESAVTETNRMLSTIKKNEAAAIGFLLSNSKEPTLENIFEASVKQEGQLSDPIANEEKQIEYILKANQIEPTELNKKAAKVLTQNNKPINTETIEIAKAALQKIETVLSELSPAVLNPLLKEGIRVEKISLDNLIERIRVVQKDTPMEPEQVAEQRLEQKLEQKLEQTSPRIAEQTVERNKPTELTTSERDQLVETYRMLSTIAKNETAAIGALLDNNKELTLQNVFEASTKQEGRFTELTANQEKQIENILKENEIEPTELNKKAAKVLTQNNKQINTENIETAKVAIQKIETVLSELSPAVLTPLLKEGAHPEKMSIDNLVERIRVIQKDTPMEPQGQVTEQRLEQRLEQKLEQPQRLSEQIAEQTVERNKPTELTTSERDQLVETYRMLSTIAKNETAAIGALLDNNKELTLQNVFEASTKQEGRFTELTANQEKQIENILKENEIEPTELNKKAAKVLTQNNKQINTENIETAKVAIQKIETVLSELSPAVLTPLLKEDVRPEKISIDNLLERIRVIQKDTPMESKEQVTEQTSEQRSEQKSEQRLERTSEQPSEQPVEQNKPIELTTSEREQLVEAYRKLSIITKNETAAAGALLGNNKELTLQNVFEASSKQEGRFTELTANQEKQIENILRANQIEPTELNKKAAKVLTQNNKQINTENIETAKVAIQKIETVLSELSPAVLTPLLKEGVYPEKMSIDNLVERIRVIQKDTPMEPKGQVTEQRLEQKLEQPQRLSEQIAERTSEQTVEQTSEQTVEPNKQIELTPQERQQATEIYRMLRTITNNETTAIGALLDNDKEFTLEDVFKATTKQDASLSEPKANEQKQIEHILKVNQIELTDLNKKAAQVLMQNNMPIDTETIETAKSLLQKIETILTELTPAVLAPILKEGFTPNKLSIDNLIERIGRRQETVEGALPQNQPPELNPEEREKLVETYRMLSTITKNETAATSVLLDNKKEPTLANLFEAAKLPMPVQNEDKQIHTENVIEQWLSRITPKELKTYIDMDKSLEEIVLKEGKISSFEVERTTKQVKALEKTSPNTLKFLKEHNIPLTIPNIYWTDKMIKNPYLLGDMLKDYENLTGEKIESSFNKNSNNQNNHNQNNHKQNLEEIIDHLEKELTEQSPKWLSASQSTQAYNMGKELEQMLSTQRQISKNEGMYQIPIELHHGMSNLNVYVMKDKEQSSQAENNELRAYMSIKTKNIGVIQVNMRISDKAVAFEMIGETPGITLGLQKSAKELKVAIEEIGYNVMQAKFSQGKVGTSLIDQPKASASLLKYRFEESKFEHII